MAVANREVVLSYAPRRVFLPFHERSERFAIGVAHRRCGKTVACINDKVRRAILTRKSLYRAGYVAPFLKQAKDIAWTYLKDYSQPLWGRAPNESELWVELLNGARIRIYGADNADALRGGYFDDVTLDEYADMAPMVWGSIVRPMLADRLGTATFIGTPKGKNAFWELFERAKDDPEWFRFLLPASQTGILSQTELEASRRDMTPEQFEQEFECSFDAAILGAYFGKEIAQADRDGRICDVPYDPTRPVHTAWDIGVADSTAIWFFQIVGPECHVIDHYEVVGMNAAHAVAEVKSRAYNLGKAWVPHDGKQRSWTAGDMTPGLAKQRVETLQAMNISPMLVPDHKVMDGINAARMLLPHCRFDATKCKTGLEALRQYRADYDEKLRTFRNTPKHDWASHTADAFRYLAMAFREIRAPAPDPKPTVPTFTARPDGTVYADMSVREIVEAKMKKRKQGRL